MTAALYDVAALRAIEAAAVSAQGGDGDPMLLMRRAGQAGWRALLERWPAARSVAVVCGPGNNGGDGYVLARHAMESGLDVCVVRLPSHDPRGPQARNACDGFLAIGGRVFASLPADIDVIVDALFGIGLDRAPTGEAAALIGSINAHGAPVLSLDVPSGIEVDLGHLPGAAGSADCTIEFLAPKAGLRTGAAPGFAGVLRLDMLGCGPGDIDPVALGLSRPDLSRWLRPRRRDSHKGRHGRVLCIGGDHGHGGAIIMAAAAALRAGAGLVDVVTRPAHLPAVLARLPEAMAYGRDDGLPDGRIEAADVVVVGPGLGRDEWGRRLLAAAVGAGKPMVLDADALNLLADTPRPLPPGSVLTPHPGEAARLLRCAASDIQRNRFDALARMCDTHDAAVVLKGAGSLVGAPARVPWLIDAGNPGMAVGGMGDVLAGVTGSLLGQGLEAFDAAGCAALLHACAGDAAALEGGERGLLPTDLMPWLRRLANPEASA